MPVDAAIISGVLTTLTPLIKDEFSLFWNFKKEVQKLSNTLSSLDAALKDAERKNLSEKDDQTEDWLRKLKDVAYEVRDIMEECTFEDLRLQVKRLNASSSSNWIQVPISITHSLTNTRMRRKIGHKIKDVQEKLDQISSERIRFQLHETTRNLKLETLTVGGRETMSLLSVNVYGRDEERKRIVDILVNSSNDGKRLSVISIIGIGGLGKTTLAQMVFNDEKVDRNFDTKLWVCISEEFDINRVMKDIVGDKSEASLEELQKKVRTQLNGKRYLIVLDDVWNEDENKWDTLRSVLDCGSDGAFVLATTRKKKVAEIMKTNQHFELSPLSEYACWLLFKERAFRDKTSKTSNLIDIGKEIAQKCKGVPLVAKTLGGQLGFKIDENEWCTIRDSEMWKISQNEKYDILSILRLSYYDLPYPLRRCFAFCAIFSKDTEIEKERLIQLWMAHDLIPINKNKEEEDVGNTIWDELCWRSFFQDEKEEIKLYTKKVQRTCKMHDLMHDLAQSVMKDECYTMDNKSSSEDFGPEIRHVTVMVKSFRKISIDSHIEGLQSIMIHPNDDYAPFSYVNLSVFKDFLSLRVLEVCNSIQSQDLRYVRCLKHLRYLSFSGSKIKTLPNSICDLLNLQTLNLNNCEYLESLPMKMKDLINLRHLHLRGCYELEYMPRGMGRLRHLKTLSLFVIGKKSDGQLDELQELNIGGYMKICNLESVSDASIATGRISMSTKSRINQLVLHWNDGRPDNDQNNKTRDEKICEALEVPATRLKTLEMRGYKGVNIPKWVGESSNSLLTLHLWNLENVKQVFTMNSTNTCVSSDIINGMEIRDMMNMRELVSPSISISTTTRAFPNLRKIEIWFCPKLGALPQYLKSLKDVSVHGECTDELLYSISDHSGYLTHLSLSNVNERSVLFGAAASRNDMNGRVIVTVFPLLQELVIEDMKNLRELVSPPILIPITTGAFPNLRKIKINRCLKLGALPPHLKSLKDVTVIGDCSDELLNSISNLSGLTYLRLHSIYERSVLFGGGNYKADNENENEITSSSSSTLAADNIIEAQGGPASSTFQSLRHLDICSCSKLSCLFDEEGCEKLARGGCLANLNYLIIQSCPELMISLAQWRILCTHSLQRLIIIDCPKLLCSKVEEEADDDVIAFLSSLRERLGSDNFRVYIHKKEDEKVDERRRRRSLFLCN